jgi:hypothetical protein
MAGELIASCPDRHIPSAQGGRFARASPYHSDRQKTSEVLATWRIEWRGY